MERHLENKLLSWKESRRRKPLILQGVRQVGKTYLLKKFGERYFNRCHYVNFELTPKIRTLFKEDLEPNRIISALEHLFSHRIDPHNDVLIFDEIQECPEALTSLKYFNESSLGLAVLSAGSLLGVTLSEQNYPVGKVDEFYLHPLTFSEFLLAMEQRGLYEQLNAPIQDIKIASVVHDKLLGLLKEYFIVGGLPEVVQYYSTTKDSRFTALATVREIQLRLLNSYFADISKHSGKTNAMQITRILQSVPAQLSRNVDGSTGRYRFKNVVPKISQYSRLANAIDWLIASGLLLKVPIANYGNPPTLAYTQENTFKLYCFDIGILGALENLDPEALLNYDFGMNKGYFVENFVLQALTAFGHRNICAWKENQAEIEFILNVKGRAIPVEVKAGRSRRAKSLSVFIKKYAPRRAIIASNQKLKEAGSIVAIPLYLAGRAADTVASESSG